MNKNQIRRAKTLPSRWARDIANIGRLTKLNPLSAWHPRNGSAGPIDPAHERYGNI